MIQYTDEFIFNLSQMHRHNRYTYKIQVDAEIRRN